jgi:3,4-dihydroxy 2-butanone 4-phosphate synthase/GTP cyclohydrolase II
MRADPLIVTSFTDGVRITNDVGSFIVGAADVEYQARSFQHLLIRRRLTEPVPLRIQSACTTGTVVGDQSCECRLQLLAAMRYLARHDAGLIIWTREHEGRGRGLVSKLQLYSLRDARGLTSEAACRELGVEFEARDFGQFPYLLRYLGVSAVTLLSTNTRKLDALVKGGIDVHGMVEL